ncbi:23S rRNA (uracil(1939)-C(5))-methyltransferase RlmD [Clostridium arbusti]|uniref:23S rRNA (uracil(1939)-C(5))-methyltransferase RlmD n=1 Tax=Clostridium arbusti TaxID=1137848 RepID=UPI0002882AEC|nr:23S rRNA (uracil(1939)-C(5))-methyltransferase RlmD [Clostridium arbusti]
MRRHKEYEFEIVDVEFPGMGVAYDKEKKIYIKGAVPGQKILGYVKKLKKEYGEAKIVKVLNTIEGQIEPKCPHFGVCGGCTHQFIDYEEQIRLKEIQLLKLFKDANMDGFQYEGIERSPKEFEYRNKMEFTFGDMEKDGELTLGMHMKNRSFGIINVQECVLIPKDFRIILDTIVSYFRNKNASYYKIMKVEGYLRNLVIRSTENTDEILVNLVTTSKGSCDEEEIVKLLMDLELNSKIVGILHTTNDSLADMVAADRIDIIYGRDYIIEKVLGLKFKISPLSFFQTNTLGAEKLYSIVMDFVGKLDSKMIFDLYCGTGTIGQIAASKKAKKVIGIELIEEAVKAANENAELNNLDNCTFIAGDVAKVIQELQDKPDVIILDPPRPGVHPKALDYVIKFNAKEIVYVSCNPKTLMVDLRKLIDSGYKVEKVKGMDMFPQTGHLECVVRIYKA